MTMISLADHLHPWHELPVCVLDWETTGPDPSTCAPVELAAVRFEGGEPVDRYSALIDPGVPIPADATAIHGITDAMVARSGDARQAWSGARSLLHGAIPCAYNAPFDRTILHRIMADALDDAVPVRFLELQSAWPWLDPLVAVRDVDRFVRGTGRHKLTAACERRGIALEGAHRATADAEAAGRLLYCADIRKALGEHTISEVLRRQEALRFAQDADFEAWRAKQPPLPTR